jgi:hypothetical protein
VVVLTPCRRLIHTSKLYGSFLFFMIFRVFSPDFSYVSLEEFFFDSFYRFGVLG